MYASGREVEALAVILRKGWVIADYSLDMTSSVHSLERMCDWSVGMNIHK